jgi:glutamate dehydrogenase
MHAGDCDLFMARFDPARTATATAAQQIDQRRSMPTWQVASLDEDRILRQFFATIRPRCAPTLADQRRRAAQALPELQAQSARVPGVPEPKPLFEIWVYSPRVEGVHLRGGKVARGGLRWSDRREDFRTEILGLVKAQQVKNTVIVPVGSKGGFVLKNAPTRHDREAFMAEGIACYKLFLSGLLDITDNVVKGTVCHRQRGAPRCGRPLPGGGSRQGHGHVLRHCQRRVGRLRLLAG